MFHNVMENRPWRLSKIFSAERMKKKKKKRRETCEQNRSANHRKARTYSKKITRLKMKIIFVEWDFAIRSTTLTASWSAYKRQRTTDKIFDCSRTFSSCTLHRHQQPYSPSNGKDKEVFDKEIDSFVKDTPADDNLIIHGDINASVVIYSTYLSLAQGRKSEAPGKNRSYK